MIRLALPKGRNLEPALEALSQSHIDLSGYEPRRLRQTLAGGALEVLMLKDWDLPLYVEYGIADCGIVGSDVLEELGSDLLVPLRLKEGGCRMSLIGQGESMPAAGSQVRVASKYPRWARRLLSGRAWGTEILNLQGSVELGPLLRLSDLAVDIVSTGTTIREHGLQEIERLAEVFPCVILNRGSFQQRRQELNGWMQSLERAGVVT